MIELSVFKIFDKELYFPVIINNENVYEFDADVAELLSMSIKQYKSLCKKYNVTVTSKMLFFKTRDECNVFINNEMLPNIEIIESNIVMKKLFK